MKKNIILLGALIISGVAYSQVGIDTDTPKATLDIKASPTSTTKIDGLIAPRLKGSELKTNDTKYTSDQDGAIVYVTEAVSGVTDKTTNVTSIGYYYFDKTAGTSGRWMKIANPTAVAPYQEPWNNQADGTPATTNSQSIYQIGSVAVGKNKVYTDTTSSTSAKFDVAGAVRGGTSQSGTVGTNSVAFGKSNESSAESSVALGQANIASGENAVALGWNNQATGNQAVAIGTKNNAVAYSTAIGRYTSATGADSFVVGNTSSATGQVSIAMGDNVITNTAGGVAIGRYNSLTTNTNGDILTSEFIFE